MRPARTDQPEAGFYATRLVKGGPEVAVHIWHGQPVIDGETLDRSPRWCCAVDGRTDKVVREADGGECKVPLDPLLDEVWPYCAGRPISEREYLFLLKRATWARAFAPEHPAANPYERADLSTLPPRF